MDGMRSTDGRGWGELDRLDVDEMETEGRYSRPWQIPVLDMAR